MSAKSSLSRAPPSPPSSSTSTPSPPSKRATTSPTSASPPPTRPSPNTHGHSERSRPTFSSAFAPANASACGCEESLFSVFSVNFFASSARPRKKRRPCDRSRNAASYLPGNVSLILARCLRRSVLPRRHGHHDIFPLFIVRAFQHFQDQFILMNPELRRFSDWQQHRMLVIFRPYPVDHPLGLQHVFLAEHFLGLFALSVGTQNLAR